MAYTGSYQYYPLRTQQEQRDTIRILTLWPGNRPDPLHGSLEHILLDHTPPFEALSYVWGRNESSNRLQCDWGELTLKENLEQALIQLRCLQQPRRLWVDAICINQEDLDERSQQVLLMRKIYAKALRVVIWLGPRSEGIDHALRLAINLYHFRMTKCRETTPDDSRALFFDSNVVKALAAAEEKGEIQPSLFAITELADLFERPWFTRIWCLQEAIASSDAVILCDDLELPFEPIITVAWAVVAFRGKPFLGQPLMFWSSVAAQKYQGHRFSDIDGSIGSLVGIVGVTRDFQATDPRDKVFAVLGIVDEGCSAVGTFLGSPLSSNNTISSRLLRGFVSEAARAVGTVLPEKWHVPKLLEIDYKKSVMAVYRDAVRFCLFKAPRSLEMLSHVQHEDDPSYYTDWPSWVPDWRAARNTGILGSTGMWAADYKHAIQQDRGFFPVLPGQLFLDGFSFDYIARVTDVIEVDFHERLEIGMLWDQLFGTSILTGLDAPFAAGESQLSAFFMTLIAGELGVVLYDGINTPSWSKLGSKHGLPLGFSDDCKRIQRDAAAFLLEWLGDEGITTGEQCERLQFWAGERGSGKAYHHRAKASGYGRRLFLTKAGRIGLGPRVTECGDTLAVLFGGRVPFVLRSRQDHFLLIGDAYVRDEDLMWGPVNDAVRAGGGEFQRQTFDIH